MALAAGCFPGAALQGVDSASAAALGASSLACTGPLLRFLPLRKQRARVVVAAARCRGSAGSGLTLTQWLGWAGDVFIFKRSCSLCSMPTPPLLQSPKTSPPVSLWATSRAACQAVAGSHGAALPQSHLLPRRIREASGERVCPGLRRLARGGPAHSIYTGAFLEGSNMAAVSH